MYNLQLNLLNKLSLYSSMNNKDFFTTHNNVITAMTRFYIMPSDVAFNLRDFPKVNWPNSRIRNFYTIIKVLAGHGACTIDEIVKYDGRPLGPNAKINRYNLYRRIILGNKEFGSSGLVGRELLSPVESKNKLIKKYELSLHGVLFALRCFCDPELIDNPFNKLKYNQSIDNYDFSKQSTYKELFVDVLAHNYSHVFPRIFGKWDSLKSNPRIDAFKICEIARNIHNPDFHPLPDFSKNSKFSSDLKSFSDTVTTYFYMDNLKLVNYPLKIFLESLESDDKEFLDKIFYSFVRLRKENYYHGMYVGALYDNDFETAKSYHTKLIKNNDLMSDGQKQDAITNFKNIKSGRISLDF